MKCKTCMWWEQEDGDMGSCFRFPQTVDKQACQGCGEWKGKMYTKQDEKCATCICVDMHPDEKFDFLGDPNCSDCVDYDNYKKKEEK